MIAAITAVDLNNAIGCENKLLANIKEDMRFFRETTKDSIVIMGRKTWDSLPKKPLPNRINIVITHHPETIEKGTKCMTLEEVKSWLDKYSARTNNNVFIIGGETIYHELLPYCEKIYLTQIYKTFDNADAYFPKFKETEKWEIESLSKLSYDEKTDLMFNFYIYNRRTVK